MGRDKPADLSPREAGHRMAKLARGYDFAFFDQWLTDYFGHRGTLADGISLLKRTDEVFAGLLEACDLDDTLIVLTSDHGNLEDINARGHTVNKVPALAVGRGHAGFLDGVRSLTDIAPAVAGWFGVKH
jgi:phosphopentomutase